jgi:hypothetical protein
MKYVYTFCDTDGYTYYCDSHYCFESNKDKDEIEFLFLEAVKKFKQSLEEFKLLQETYQQEVRKNLRKSKVTEQPEILKTFNHKLVFFGREIQGDIDRILNGEYTLRTLDEFFEQEKTNFII